eukprot:4180896-Pleurochrysis_carterae.AAC.2
MKLFDDDVVSIEMHRYGRYVNKYESDMCTLVRWSLLHAVLTQGLRPPLVFRFFDRSPVFT